MTIIQTEVDTNDKQTEQFKELINKGWVIWKTSCICGGKYAWLKPKYNTKCTYTMVGCICHNDPKYLLKGE